MAASPNFNDTRRPEPTPVMKVDSAYQVDGVIYVQIRPGHQAVIDFDALTTNPGFVNEVIITDMSVALALVANAKIQALVSIVPGVASLFGATPAPPATETPQGAQPRMLLPGGVMTIRRHRIAELTIANPTTNTNNIIVQIETGS